MRRRTFLGAAAATAIAACAPTPFGQSDLVGAMPLEKRVGQLMSVAFHGTRVTGAIESMIREKGVGGVILYTENFSDGASLTKLIGDLSQIARDAGVPPLFFEIDQEGGAVVRIAKGATVLPGQMALAATPDPTQSVLTAVGITSAELRAIGINWNLAPDADVNDEPTNPVIGNRSFSSDPSRVAALVTTAIQAYAAAGFLCCAKHFPGHGSTTVDSHNGLPKIDADRATLDRIELAPFRAAIAAAAPAIMSAHIVVPSLDATPDLPVTLSKPVLTDLLRGTLGFQGLIVTDDLEMGALASVGEANAGLRAFQAGADFMLFRFDESAQRAGHQQIWDAARADAGLRARVEASARRIVDLKRRFGILDERRDAAAPDLAANARVALDLARGSITLLRNQGGLLPIRGKVLVIAPANADIAVLPDQAALGPMIARKRPDAILQTTPLRPAASDIDKAVTAARQVDAVLIGTTDLFASDEQAQLVRAVAAARPVCVVSLRGPYDVMSVPSVPAYICAYDGREPSLVAASEVIFGDRKPVGALPVDIPGLYRIGAGMKDFA